jgi:hypothetical protein
MPPANSGAAPLVAATAGGRMGGTMATGGRPAPMENASRISWTSPASTRDRMKSGRVYRAATGLAEDREGADTSCSYPGIDISRKRFSAPSTSAMFHSMYRAST